MVVRRGFLPDPVWLSIIAALYFAWGCGSGLELSDEGQIVFPSWRTAAGALPYRDFSHLYGPSLFFLNGAFLRWFGEDLLTIRISLVVFKSLAALLVYGCARLVASRPLSLLAYALFVAMWGTPFVFNTPYANHYATILMLGGAAVFLALRPRFSLACFLAGLCFGIAATFKQTIGALSAVWFALFLLMETPYLESSGGRTARFSMPERIPFVRIFRWMVLLGAIGAVPAYQATGTTPWNALVVSGPLLGLIFVLCWREIRGETSLAQDAVSAWGIVCCAAGACLPVLGYVVFYASLGQLQSLVFNTVGLAEKVTWFVPLPFPDARTLVWGSTIVTMFLAVHFCRVPPGGDGSRRFAAAVFAGLFLISFYFIWDGMRMPRGAGAFFRSGIWYGEVFRIVFLLPIGIILVGLPAVLARTDGRSAERERMRQATALRLFLCAATTSLLFLHPAADILHVLMVIPIFLPILAWELNAFQGFPAGSLPRGSRFLSGIAVVVFGVLLSAPFVHATLRARFDRSGILPRMPRATGIVGQMPGFATQVEIASYLRAHGGDQGALILTNEQLLYFLSGKVSVMEQQEFILYLVGADAISAEDARALVPEERFVERLKATRPMIVDAAPHKFAARFHETFPAVMSYIAGAYRLTKEIGPYRVLGPRED